MPSQKLELEIVTPDRLLFSGEVDEVMVPGSAGYLGILPHHAPLLSELRVGIISFQQERRKTELFCSWGFVEILPNQVSILAEIAEFPDQIDVETARQGKAKAEQLLRSKQPDLDYRKLVLDLEKADTRIKVAQLTENITSETRSLAP